jgi:ParB-like chromosome segregation protein Spo0J
MEPDDLISRSSGSFSIQEQMPATLAPPTDPAAIRNATIRIADYAAHPRNYNAHSADQIARLAASLTEFGQTKPVVVWRNYFLAGHGVRAAALSLGWTELDARIVPDEWPEEKALAYLVADNRLSQLADPDTAQLASLLQWLDEQDAGLRVTAGYDDADLAATLLEVERVTLKEREAVKFAARQLRSDGVVRLAVWLADLSVVEQALHQTGLRNRGEAIAEICRCYVDSNETAAMGQSERPTEDRVAA